MADHRATTARYDAIYAEWRAGRPVTTVALARRHGLSPMSVRKLIQHRQRREAGLVKVWTPEERIERARKGGQKAWANVAPEERARRLQGMREGRIRRQQVPS